MKKLVLLSSLFFIANVGWSQMNLFRPAKVSYSDFKDLVSQVEAHRKDRLVDLNTFLEMSTNEQTVILDTRSTMRYDRIHVKGAIHLNFSDFTQSNLASLIPDPNTRILIYCNNNFSGNQVDFTTKVASPTPIPSPNSIEGQIMKEEKPIMMALNIPTYINLYGYGYRNVYELNELVDVNDPRIKFEGSVVKNPPLQRPLKAPKKLPIQKR